MKAPNQITVLLSLVVITILATIYFYSESEIVYNPDNPIIKFDLNKKLTTIKHLSNIEDSPTIKNKWIVVTSINEPTEQIKVLSKINQFQLLVVGDKKSKPNWTCENVVYLDITKQRDLNYNSFKTTPFNSYTRKNIGYLFAIENGARFIYDTDDDNAPIVDLNKYFNFDEHDYGLTFDTLNIKSYNKCSVIDQNVEKIQDDLLNGLVLNPYAHFGQPTIWPRGYPLSQINKNHENKYSCGKRKASLVQQGVVNGDPDVDAIFRLTKSGSDSQRVTRLINIKFDPSSPSIQYPLYRVSPYNSQNTLIHYDAFWSLYLPKTVPFRLTDIWRSYWSQRLLWLINGTVQFNGPNAFQLRNVHSYLKDFKEETDMYLKTEDLIKFLLFKWKCAKLKFYECLLDLSLRMAENGFWGLEEVDGIKNWLKDLERVDYLEPEMVNFEQNEQTKCVAESISVDSARFPVRFTPKYQKPLEMDTYCCNGSAFDVFDNFESFNYLIGFCKQSGYEFEGILGIGSSSAFLNTKPKTSNITLLITFNREVRPKNIVLLKHIYGSYFNSIVFCGKDIVNQLNDDVGAFKKFDSYTFIELDTVNGYFHYFCMTKAIEMNYVTDGILLMSDDVLLKYWLLDEFDADKIWYPSPALKKSCSVKAYKENKKLHYWEWWHTYMGIDAVLNLWDYFENVRNSSISIEKENFELIKSYLSRLDERNSYQKIPSVCMHASDIFYLNKNSFRAFHLISSLFRRFSVFLELAVPTILAGIEDENNFLFIDGTFKSKINFNRYDKLG